ncbi:MAG: sporulation protein [Candidatus Thermoplasmatota archaeon]|nr:sporulation protein [Candidatus Thermoplasmatota archaeon]
MGFLDKVKSAGSAMTGGAAKVSLEYPHQPMKPGDSINVKVTVVSTGKEVKSGGVFVDVHAAEKGQVKCKNAKCQQMVNISNETVKQAISIAPAFVLQPNETKVFESTIQLPMGQPTYHGVVNHEWMIRGRLEAFGNDPDSGFQRIEVR